MKSTKKPFYNHRIAQSKEKWETDFLSKVTDANGLLYLAAVKSNGYAPINDSYYTEENKPKILSTLDEIVNNPYNQKYHKNFASLLEGAKSKLDSKIVKKPVQQTQQPTQQPTQQQKTNGGISAEDVNGKTRFKSDIQTYEGDQIRDIIKKANLIAEKDPAQLKFQWPSMKKEIDALWQFIDPNEKIELTQDIRDINMKMNNQFNPQGGEMLSTGAFVAYTPERIATLLGEALANQDVAKANELIDNAQQLWNTGLSNMTRNDESNSTFIRIRNGINQYNRNFKNREKQVKTLNLNQVSI